MLLIEETTLPELITQLKQRYSGLMDRPTGWVYIKPAEHGALDSSSPAFVSSTDELSPDEQDAFRQALKLRGFVAIVEVLDLVDEVRIQAARGDENQMTRIIASLNNYYENDCWLTE